MLSSLTDKPSDAVIKEILGRHKRVAVVGLSANPERDSHRVAKYMQAAGYEVFPVNPKETEILGRQCYPDLASLPAPVEVVDVFRRSEFVPQIVEEAIAVGASAIWLQLGVRHEQAAEKARQAGITVVQDLCIKVEHHRLMRH